jgi:hypothetical protein
LETHLPKDAAKPIWRYALARMNIDELEIQYKSAFVQRWANVRDTWMNPRASYTLFNFEPALVKPDESRATP